MYGSEYWHMALSMALKTLENGSFEYKNVILMIWLLD